MANMAVAFAPVQIRPPKEKIGHHGIAPLKVWVVRVWEVDPPAGEERLEWFLVTNEPVQTFDDAYRVVGWYECRWIVEAYHGPTRRTSEPKERSSARMANHLESLA